MAQMHAVARKMTDAAIVKGRRILFGAAVIALPVDLHAVNVLPQPLAVQADARQRAAKRAGDAAQQFSHSAHFLEFFIRRESVASASVNLRGIAAYATSENSPDFFNETDKLIEQLAMMQHLYISVF